MRLGKHTAHHSREDAILVEVVGHVLHHCSECAASIKHLIS